MSNKLQIYNQQCREKEKNLSLVSLLLPLFNISNDKISRYVIKKNLYILFIRRNKKFIYIIRKLIKEKKYCYYSHIDQLFHLRFKLENINFQSRKIRLRDLS